MQISRIFLLTSALRDITSFCLTGTNHKLPLDVAGSIARLMADKQYQAKLREKQGTVYYRSVLENVNAVIFIYEY
jgi:hypothetical protein